MKQEEFLVARVLANDPMFQISKAEVLAQVARQVSAPAFSVISALPAAVLYDDPDELLRYVLFSSQW